MLLDAEMGTLGLPGRRHEPDGLRVGRRLVEGWSVRTLAAGAPGVGVAAIPASLVRVLLLKPEPNLMQWTARRSAGEHAAQQPFYW
jgi:hypothetical protein